MSKKYKYILFLLSLLLMNSCDKDSGIKTPEPLLKVVESNITFSTQGGSGFIKVSAPGSITATSNEDWCKIESVTETTINLLAEKNTSMGGRSATISILYGEETTEVTAVQTAAKLVIENQTFNVDFTPTSVKTAVIADNEVTVSSNDEWIEAKYENDSIIINVALNPNASKRTGSVTVTSGVVSQTVEINQAERTFAFEDLLGDWEMTFQLFPPATRYVVNIKLEKSATPNYYDVTGLGFGILKIRFNNTNKTLEIYGGHNMGPDPTDPSRTIVALFLSSDGYITWNPAAFYRGVWNKEFNENMIFNFVDTGTWTDKTIFGLYFVSSTQYPIVSETFTYIGTLLTNISIKKI